MGDKKINWAIHFGKLATITKIAVYKRDVHYSHLAVFQSHAFIWQDVFVVV